jgi:hypothetical protein
MRKFNNFKVVMLTTYFTFLVLFFAWVNFDQSKLDLTYGIVQFDARGNVVRTEKVISFDMFGDCVLFQTPEFAVRQIICGSLYVGVISELDVPGMPSEKAQYQVVQYDADMHVLRTWYATMYWTRRGSIGFKTEAMPSVQQYVSGNVSAFPLKP